MTDREFRLRQRIDTLLNERDHYRDLAKRRGERLRFCQSKIRDLRSSREHWKAVAGARIRERLAA